MVRSQTMAHYLTRIVVVRATSAILSLLFNLHSVYGVRTDDTTFLLKGWFQMEVCITALDKSINCHL